MSLARPAAAGVGGRDGGGGNRGGGGGDDRNNHKRHRQAPLDKMGDADFLKFLSMMDGILDIANLGDLPSKVLITGTPGEKVQRPKSERTQAVKKWAESHRDVAMGLACSRYTELAQSFVHMLRAANTAGLWDRLIEWLTEQLTQRAMRRDSEMHDD